LACFLAFLQAKDADLAKVVKVWTGLPEHIKAAIKALVKTVVDTIEGR
jgi:hypothetical protein